ncbi:MAG: hypothetical protein AAF346_24935 [Pseudomonadota bacterium]
MRLISTFTILLLISAAPAIANWTVTASNGYACKSPEALKQLRIMSAVPSAFDVALLDKLSSGECRKLQQGEAVEKLEDDTLPPSAIKLRRSNGDELYAPERFVGQST